MSTRRSFILGQNSTLYTRPACFHSDVSSFPVFLPHFSSFSLCIVLTQAMPCHPCTIGPYGKLSPYSVTTLSHAVFFFFPQQPFLLLLFATQARSSLVLFPSGYSKSETQIMYLCAASSSSFVAVPSSLLFFPSYSSLLLPCYHLPLKSVPCWFSYLLATHCMGCLLRLFPIQSPHLPPFSLLITRHSSNPLHSTPSLGPQAAGEAKDIKCFLFFLSFPSSLPIFPAYLLPVSLIVPHSCDSPSSLLTTSSSSVNSENKSQSLHTLFPSTYRVLPIQSPGFPSPFSSLFPSTR